MNFDKLELFKLYSNAFGFLARLDKANGAFSEGFFYNSYLEMDNHEIIFNLHLNVQDKNIHPR